MRHPHRVLMLAAATLAFGCGDGNGGAAARPSASAAGSGSGSASEAPTEASAAARKGVRLRRIGSFDSPVYVTAPPGDRRRLFVVEQAGRIRVLVDGRKRGQPFLDIAGQVTAGGEQGLLSMAFAPDYAMSGLFYVYFTDRNGDERIVEYRRATAERADAGSARLLILQRDNQSNHNGGLLLFGPDGLLYTGLGDGGGAGDQHGPRGNGQNLGTLLGKILRIDPRPSGGRPYGIPTSNPFVGRSGARGEIWAYGLRNPWRFAFDPATKAMIVADVGQNEVEEVSVAGAGSNLGWRVFEGRKRYTAGEAAPGAVPPIIERLHSRGNCSITGGVVVRDRGLPALRGRYVFGDYCKGVIESARIRGGKARGVRSTKLHVDSLSSFGEDARGRAYAVSLEGPVYRLVPRG
jgi:glucose/arabinose dehydrogenase